MTEIKLNGRRRHDHAAGGGETEASMKKAKARAITFRAAYAQQDFVARWSGAMWILALIYLLAAYIGH